MVAAWSVERRGLVKIDGRNRPNKQHDAEALAAVDDADIECPSVQCDAEKLAAVDDANAECGTAMGIGKAYPKCAAISKTHLGHIQKRNGQNLHIQ